MNEEEVIKIVNYLTPYDLPYSTDDVYIAIKKLLDLYFKEKEKNKELYNPSDMILRYYDSKKKMQVEIKGFISKNKLKEIIYPSPENPIPIEIQQSEMYKKLVKEVEE